MNLKKNIQNLKTNWLTILAVLILFLFFSGFNLNSFPEIQNFPADSSSALGVARGFPPGTSEDIAPDVKDRIKTFYAYIGIEVSKGKIQEATDKIKSEIKKTSSILINENFNSYNNGAETIKTASFSIKVPVSEYSDFLEFIKSSGTIVSLTEQSDDITGHATNLQIELKAEQARLERLESLYSIAKTAEEKISLTDKIFEQERRIYYLEEALSTQGQTIDYATISLTIQEKESPFKNIKLITLTELLKSFITSLSSMIRLIVIIIPYAIAVFIIWFVYKKLKNRK